MPDGIKLNIAQIIIIGNRYGWKALSFYGRIAVYYIYKSANRLSVAVMRLFLYLDFLDGIIKEIGRRINISILTG